jgi:hypothetical protein
VLAGQEVAMPKFSYEADSSVPPERVLAALTDFSDSRPNLWPTIDRRTYVVHSVGETSAEVTEGSPQMGGFWGREHYDWSSPGVVRATLGESNIGLPGGIWEFHVDANPSGGSHVRVQFERRMKGLKGAVSGLFLTLFGKMAFRANLLKTLKILEGQTPASSST